MRTLLDDDIVYFVTLWLGMIALGGGLVLLGVAEPGVILAFGVLGSAPLVFIGLLWIGFKGDEFFGVEDAWAYTLLTGSDRDE